MAERVVLDWHEKLELAITKIGIVLFPVLFAREKDPDISKTIIRHCAQSLLAFIKNLVSCKSCSKIVDSLVSSLLISLDNFAIYPYLLLADPELCISESILPQVLLKV